MNATPHTHQLVIRDYGSWWHVEYGDQSSNPDKTHFRKPENVLKGVAKQLIAKHDRESIKAGRVNTIGVMATVVATMTPKDPNKWGVEQLPD